MLAERMHSNRSYISFLNVLGGLLLFLDKASDPINSKELGKIIKNIAYLIIWKAVEIQEPCMICDEISKIYRNIDS